MNTREKIVRVADELIRMRGYNAFSYKDIAATLDIRNAAVHYHFHTKGDLGVQVVELEMGVFRDHMRASDGLPPAEQLRRLVNLFHRHQQNGLLCLMGSFSADYSTLPEAVKTKVRELSAYIVDWVTRLLETGRDTGTLRFEGRPYDRALVVLADLMSSLLLSRVIGPDAFERVSTQILQDLNIQHI